MSTVTPAAEPQYAAYVGIDWGDREHAWALEVAGSGKIENGKLPQTPEALEIWATDLASRFGERPIAVGVEQSRGALIYALQKFSHLVFYPIHPNTSTSYRAAMSPSGAKDDPVDAGLLLDLVVRHRDRLRCLHIDTVETRKLQALVEKRRQLVDERTAQTNRITDLLKQYYPQALAWVDDLSSPLGVAFLQCWPTLQKLQKEPPEVVRAFFLQYGSRSQQRIQERLDGIQKARPALEDPAIIDPCVLMLQALLDIVTGLRQGIERLQKAIDQIFAQHPDAPIFASFPGAAKVMAPRLLAAFGSQRDRWESLQDFQNYSGIPPVTVRSGKSRSVHFRWACPKFLRQTFHEFAAISVQQSEWARAYYHHRRHTVNQDHQAAVRSLAYKWERILYRCWINRTPYQETIHQERLLSKATPAPSADHKPKTEPPRPSKRPNENPVHFEFKKVAGFWKISDQTS
jgi:transposase